ncbi:MAG TPA: hypothetical protein DF774_07475 [Rheinheimera sp.]|nr:hypothetical protein [Rheinheimera sp.]
MFLLLKQRVHLPRTFHIHDAPSAQDKYASANNSADSTTQTATRLKDCCSVMLQSQRIKPQCPEKELAVLLAVF